MRKLLTTIFLLTILLTVAMLPRATRASESAPAPQYSTADQVIDAVNALRAENGLAPYAVNVTLMQISQEQAEFILSSGTMTSISENGLKPFQRALMAGYAVAGDIYTGEGLFSENITGGSGMTAIQAVEKWEKDKQDLETMNSEEFQDIGVGVAISGYTFVYVLDCGLSTEGTPRAFTPPPTYKTPVVTLAPPTPNADGSVTYIVQPNDTLLGIAIAYNISLTDLYALNGLTEKSVIYPDQVLILSSAFTATPTQATGTPTERPTITPWPTSTVKATLTPIPPTPTPSGKLPVSAAGTAVGIIVGIALVVALVVALVGKKKSG